MHQHVGVHLVVDGGPHVQVVDEAHALRLGARHEGRVGPPLEDVAEEEEGAGRLPKDGVGVVGVVALGGSNK